MIDTTLRVVLDVIAGSVLAILVVRSATHLTAAAAWFVVAGTLGPLITYLALSTRGYRGVISLDLAYASLLAVTAIRSRGNIWRFLPEEYWRNIEEEGRPPRLQMGVVDLVAFLALYLSLEHFIGMGILE
ncbi:hypothetical protein GCM10022237_28810 [Nocardioides ginsengisoli]|uniref:Uncharacterized protein n=1 Tax=Nocardioides ginsengisoli TaxID=363868 RepID=A0ABW3W5V0_9ACTN